MSDGLLADGVWLRLIWQGTAWLAAGLAASFVSRRRPARAHAVLAIALGGLFATPFANLAVSYFGCGLFQAAAVPSHVAPAATSASAELLEGDAAFESLVADAPSSEPPEPTSVEQRLRPAERSLASERSFRPTLRNVLSIIWMLMSTALGARLALATWRARRLAARMTTIAEGRLSDFLAEAAAQLGLRVTPVLGMADIRSPIVWCWGRSPTVLVPMDAEASGAGIDWVGVFRHELAHWKRKDHLTGFLAEAAIVLLPWNPLTWWAARRLHELSEQACDQWAVADGRSPLDFAESLLSLHPENRQRAALAAVSSGRLLAVRVRRLLQGAPAEPRAGRIWTAVVLGMSLLMIAALALSQDAPAQSAARAVAQNQAVANAEAELHVIGIYGPKDLPATGRVEVTVRPTSRPIVLVLSSYWSVNWHITPDDGVRIKQVILTGFYTQEVTGLPEDVPLVNQSYAPTDGSRRKDGWFFAYQWDTIEYRHMVEKLNERTGLLVSTAQLEYTGSSFVVDGKQGRNYAQKERKPRRVLPTEPTPEELRALCANSELHVLGTYESDAGNGAPVDVEVRPTGRPMVLAMSSYSSVLWNLKVMPGAQLKAVIISGHSEQEFEGIPSGVPIVLRTSFPDQKPGWFIVYEWDTVEYRRLMKRLDMPGLPVLTGMTGLEVSTLQAEGKGNSFVVDGTRGRDTARKVQAKDAAKARDDGNPPPKVATEPDAELHVIGIYEPKRSGEKPGKVEVNVRPTSRPVVLVLSSYRSVSWQIKVAEGARIKQVIVSGYSEQEITGLPADVPIVNQSYLPLDDSRRKEGWFFAYQWDTLEYRRMVETLNDRTGLLVSTAQLEHTGESFVVDGKQGHNYAQKERKPRRAAPIDPTPEELSAASAGAELHVVGAYGSDAGNGAPVDVEVRPTGKPIVLVMSSYYSILWRVKIAKGAQLKAVIIGGYFEQEFEGIPEGVPIVSRTYFPGQKRDYFYAYSWNTSDYRRMVEKLNDMTGLLVSTFQPVSKGTSFIIDGVRGGKYAQKERKPRRALPTEPTPEELLATAKGAELHVVGTYLPAGGHGAPVDVEVRPTGKPIVLVMSSYGSVLWNVKVAEGAQLKAVIICGYYEQEFEGIPEGVPIVSRTFFPTRQPVWFYGYDDDSSRKEYLDLLSKLKEMTGLQVTTSQGANPGTSFLVDGTRGTELDRKARAADATKAGDDSDPPQKAAADPLADVADVRSQDLRAGGDADKRYFLIGPREDAVEPAEGYGLVVILPGGDGSADFHPFVKRIYKNALTHRYLAVQPIAIPWGPDQKIVWPTKSNPVAGMKFSTEELVEAVIEDAAGKHKLDRSKVFSLSGHRADRPRMPSRFRTNPPSRAPSSGCPFSNQNCFPRWTRRTTMPTSSTTPPTIASARSAWRNRPGTT